MWKLKHHRMCCSFLPHNAMLAWYMPLSCVCLSVSLSACLSQVNVLLKRLNVGSRKQRHTIVQHGTLVFWCRKSRKNSNEVTPNWGAKCRWGRLNAGAVAANWQLLMWSFVNLVNFCYVLWSRLSWLPSSFFIVCCYFLSYATIQVYLCGLCYNALKFNYCLFEIKKYF